MLDVYTVKDVGTAESPITLDINLIKSKQIVNFLSGKTYYINPINLKDLDHIHFILDAATIVVKGSAGYFLQAENCNYLTIEGGTILGYEGAETGRKIAN